MLDKAKKLTQEEIVKLRAEIKEALNGHLAYVQEVHAEFSEGKALAQKERQELRRDIDQIVAQGHLNQQLRHELQLDRAKQARRRNLAIPLRSQPNSPRLHHSFISQKPIFDHRPASITLPHHANPIPTSSNPISH